MRLVCRVWAKGDRGECAAGVRFGQACLRWLGSRWLRSSCGRFGGMTGRRGVASLGRGLGRSQVVGGVAPPAASAFQPGGSKP